ncbi:N(4)-bis(aminopropyl)spermidine synthase [Balamuthia mandrillaris]
MLLADSCTATRTDTSPATALVAPRGEPSCCRLSAAGHQQMTAAAGGCSFEALPQKMKEAAEQEPPSDFHPPRQEEGATVPAADLLRLLYTLKTKAKEGKMDPCALLNLQDASLRDFYDQLQRLQQEGWAVLEEGVLKLTEKADKALQRYFNTDTAATNDIVGMSSTQPCCQCETRGYHCPSNFNLLHLFNEIAATRPSAKEEFDQWYMSPQHALHRVGFMHARGDLLGKRIFILGDDDLLSLACALTGLPERVVCVEADQRLIDFLNAAAKRYNLRLEAHLYDARFALPQSFQRSFDVFASDPVETVEGCKVFLSRGVASLKGPGIYFPFLFFCAVIFIVALTDSLRLFWRQPIAGSVIYFGLTTLECNKQKWFGVQKLVSGMGFSMTDIVRNFTEYEDPGWEDRLPFWANLGLKPTAAWYKSSFWRLEAIQQPVPAVIGSYDGEWNFFHDADTWATTAPKF